MSKFKNCFISKLPQYRYDIVIDGEKIATAHLQNAADKAYIEAKSSKKTYSGGEMMIDFASQELITTTLERSLDSWTLSEPLSRKAIEDLTSEAREAILTVIQEHESATASDIEDAEKN